tara:strand:+ start:496 stop:780 length:285 start_codon:yes stop_codon:yes gene_type:complete
VIIYEVCDYDEFRCYYSNKAKAIKAARDYYKDKTRSVAQQHVLVHKIDLGKLDQAKVIKLLEGHSYIEHQELVKTVERPKNWVEDDCYDWRCNQ